MHVGMNIMDEIHVTIVHYDTSTIVYYAVALIQNIYIVFTIVISACMQPQHRRNLDADRCRVESLNSRCSVYVAAWLPVYIKRLIFCP